MTCLKFCSVCSCVISYFLTHPVAYKLSNYTKWWGNKKWLRVLWASLLAQVTLLGLSNRCRVRPDCGGRGRLLLLNCTYLQSCCKWFYVYSAGQVLRFLYSMLFIALPLVLMIWLLIRHWIRNDECNHESGLFFGLPVTQAIFIFNFRFLLQ